MKSAAQALQKWLDGTANAQGAITAGVNAVGPDKNPMERAAAAQQKWADAVARAARNGTFAAGLRAVTLESWRQAMIQKGVPNYLAGTAFAKQKMGRFLQALLSVEAQVVAQLPPRGTLGQNVQRMTQFVNAMALMQYNKGTSQFDQLGGGAGNFQA